MAAILAEFDKLQDTPVPMLSITTTTELYYRPIIVTTSCSKHGMFHCHSSLLNQVLTRPVQVP